LYKLILVPVAKTVSRDFDGKSSHVQMGAQILRHQKPF